MPACVVSVHRLGGPLARLPRLNLRGQRLARLAKSGRDAYWQTQFLIRRLGSVDLGRNQAETSCRVEGGLFPSRFPGPPAERRPLTP